MKTKIFILLFIILLSIGLFNSYKSLPENISLSGQIFSVPDESVTFLSDLTYTNQDSEKISEQEIFDEVFEMIDEAENFILVDMFLYNDYMGKENSAYRKISSELTQKLIENKIQNPNLKILVITDPINTIYGGVESPDLNLLEEAGVMVVKTNIRKLRDSNAIYSSLWRPFLRFLPVKFVKLPNPFVENGEAVGLNTYFELLNFKANHRKVLIADFVDQNGNLKVASLVTSANPHDGSSRHSNVAAKVEDFVWMDILKSELSVVNFSSELDPNFDFNIDQSLYKNDSGDVMVQLLTEKEIKKSLLNSINQTKENDEIKMLMFYLSDRDIVKSLKKANERGVDVKIILDPNKDAFGREKNGVPNVSVAKEFKKSNQDFQIKWCNTDGEQCHGKMVLISNEKGQELFIGSANLTRRNIGNYNLETNMKISGDSVTAINDATDYFDRIWTNQSAEYSVDYDVYKDESLLKYLQYRIMESAGISSF